MSHPTSILLLFISLLLFGCSIEQQRREINTLANLQTLSKVLRRSAGAESAVQIQDFENSVGNYFDNGKDLWGSPILFIPASESNQSTFLLISMGTDRRLDVSDPLKYYQIDEPVRSQDQEGKDIVLRGKKAVSYGASK